MQVPTINQLNDLSNLLELIRAASNPEETSKAIESLRQERKQFDDAIAQAEALTKSAAESMVNVEAEMAKLSERKAELDLRQDSINAQYEEISVRNADADARQAAVSAREIALHNAEQALASRAKQIDQDLKVREQRISDSTNALTQREAELATNIKQAEDAKAEYEALSTRVRAAFAG